MILFVARLMLNQSSIMCSDVEEVTGSLSSRGTGSIPLVSTLLRLVIHRRSFVCGLGSGMVALIGSFEELVVSSCWLMLWREGDPWIFSMSSGLIVIRVRLCSLKVIFCPGPSLVEVCAVRLDELLTRLKLVYTSVMYSNTIGPQQGRNGKIGWSILRMLDHKSRASA